MLICLTRNFFILINAIYIFFRILNITKIKKIQQIMLFSVSGLISLFAGFTFINNQSFNWLFIILFFFSIMLVCNNFGILTTWISTLISFALSFIMFSISTLIFAVFLIPLFYEKYEIYLLPIRISVGMLQSLFVYYCFRIPRLKKGMSFLYNIPFNNIGSLSSILLFICIILFSNHKNYTETFILKFSFIILSLSFLLIYWWNYHITQTYLKFSKNNTLDTLSLLLEEKEQQIAYLKSENDKLARIIHKDNKILPALCMALPDAGSQTAGFMVEEKQEQTTLHAKLRQLYEERKETLENYQKEILRLPQTAFDSVNALLSYMQAEAGKAGTGFGVVLSDNLSSTIPAEISEDDFTHVLSDLLANAVNACRGINGTDIRVTMGKAEHMSVLTVRNTGQLFPPEVLQDLGKKRHTTHADTGGSGIGLMDIWEIKKRYRATLLIEETLGTAEQLPSVTMRLLFNHKNHYIIQSERSKELTATINRPDVMIMARD